MQATILTYLPHPMLRPIVALVAWTLLMQLWMIVTRLAALREAGVNVKRLVGSKASDADRALPARTQWVAHNYNHLLEQPTLFYAVVLVLALSGGGSVPAINLAWAFVVLRVCHSLWQVTVNRVDIRLGLWLASSMILAVLTVLAWASVS